MSGYGTVTSAEDVDVTVKDNEPAAVVTFGSATYSVAESDDPDTTGDDEKENEATVKVKLDQDPDRQVIVQLTVTQQGTDGSNDYTGVPASVTFEDGDTEQSFTFKAVHDTIDDGEESVKLGFRDLPARVTPGTPNETTISILDDDPGTVTITPKVLNITEGNHKDYEVVLDSRPSENVVITIAKTGDASVTLNKTALTFTKDDWDTEQAVRVSAGQDAGHEGGTADITHTAASDDDDYDDNIPVTVTFEQDTYTVAEADDDSTDDVTENSVSIKVSVNKDPGREIVIPIGKAYLDGASSADHEAIPASVTLDSDTLEEAFAFTAVDDSGDDDDEKVKLTLGPLPGAVTQGTHGSATISITDDDKPTALTVEFGSAAYSATEGATASVKIKLSDDPERNVTIPVSGTSVTFASGDTEKSITFTAVQDTAEEDTESVKLTFGTLPTTPVSITEGTVKETTLSILDDDARLVRVVPTRLEIDEGDDDTYTVVLTEEPDAGVSIAISKTGSSDVTFSPAGPLSFTTGNWSQAQTVTVEAAQDDGHDDDEATISHAATSTDSDFNGTDVSSVAVKVLDDDNVPVKVSFEKDVYSVDESDDSGTTGTEENKVTVKVKLDADPEREVVVTITKTDQMGADSADYEGVPASITFDSGETEKSFVFTAKHDTADDDDESVKLALTGLPADVSLGDHGETVISINDDDKPTALTVEFGSSAYSVNEGASIKVLVKLSDDPEQDVTIPISKTNQDEASDADYTLTSTSLTFRSDDTRKELTFAAADDSEDDEGEKVKLTFGTLPATPLAVTAGTTSQTIVSINDLDITPVTVEFESAAYAVQETDDTATMDVKENEVEITATLDKDPGREVIIPINKAHQGGATSADYQGVPDTLTFESGDTEKSFTFKALHDTQDDDQDSVKLTFGGLPAGVSAGDDDEAVISIADDDLPDITVRFGSAAYQAGEGDTVDVVLELSAQPEREVIIPITATKQGDISDLDFGTIPATVTFNATEERKTITFRALEDDEDEENESVRLDLGTLPTQVGSGTQTTTLVTIIDNDTAKVDVSETSLTVPEGGPRTYDVVLETKPSHDVTVAITVTGDSDITTDRPSLTFTRDNWHEEQPVTVEAAHDDDSANDSATITHLASSTDANYQGRPGGSVAITATDDDDPGSPSALGRPNTRSLRTSPSP